MYNEWGPRLKYNAKFRTCVLCMPIAAMRERGEQFDVKPFCITVPVELAGLPTYAERARPALQCPQGQRFSRRK